MSRPSVLFIGTGYVAGSVLTLLLKENAYDISATTRKDDHLHKLKELGVEGIKASLDDSALITQAVKEHDIIINGASSDHPGSVDATLKGIEERSAQGKRTIYIHTSGTGVLDDRADGQHKNATVYTDESPDQVEALDDGQPHRAIDKKISRVAEQLKDTASIRVILPPLIYGQGSGPFNQLSVQTPTLLRADLKYGFSGVWGEGQPRWSNVHVRDLAEGYVLLLHALEQNRLPAKTPYDIYVFAAAGEHKWHDLSVELGKRLHARGALKSPDVRSFSKQQLHESGLELDLGAEHLYQTVGGNSLSYAHKLRSLGWSPKQQPFFDTLDYDIDQVLAEQK